MEKRVQIAMPLLLLLCLSLLAGCNTEETPPRDISDGNLRKVVFALVSSAENSSTDYSAQYGYIEDIGDGRGYTAGIIGFTSGTGDLFDVVRRYTTLQSENDLKKYLPALEKVNGSDSHEGLGEAFVKDWETAAADKTMIQAQDDILTEQYRNPAIQYAREEGLSPLGQYLYYDALVVHGDGDSTDSFGGIRTEAQTKATPPAKGGDEAAYLLAFLEARTTVMLKEEAHSDLSRLDAQKGFIEDGNFQLELPLKWLMYGEAFTLTEQDLATMP